MFLKWVTDCLLFLTLFYLLPTGAETIRADEGETVRLPCYSSFTDSEQVSVEWTKNSTTTCRWNINNNTVYSNKDCIPRFSFTKTPFTLNIENVQLSDSGNYSCKTTKIIPPPTVDENSNVILQVAGLSLQLLNSSNDTCIHLICSLESPNPELVNFTWSREGQMIPHISTTNATKTELHLCKPDWSERDTITCHANNSSKQTKKSLQLPSEISYDKNYGTQQVQWVIIACSAAACLVFCIILIVVLCKCRKPHETGSIVFSNKVYENFSFAMSRQNTQDFAKPQTEECIYEN